MRAGACIGYGDECARVAESRGRASEMARDGEARVWRRGDGVRAERIGEHSRERTVADIGICPGPGPIGNGNAGANWALSCGARDAARGTLREPTGRACGEREDSAHLETHDDTLLAESR